MWGIYLVKVDAKRYTPGSENTMVKVDGIETLKRQGDGKFWDKNFMWCFYEATSQIIVCSENDIKFHIGLQHARRIAKRALEGLHMRSFVNWCSCEDILQ